MRGGAAWRGVRTSGRRQAAGGSLRRRSPSKQASSTGEHRSSSGGMVECCWGRRESCASQDCAQPLPALQIRRSKSRPAFRQRRTNARALSSEARSRASTSTLPPPAVRVAAASAAAAAAPRSAERQASTTLAPAATSACAVAYPTPALPPVTIAVCREQQGVGRRRQGPPHRRRRRRRTHLALQPAGCGTPLHAQTILHSSADVLHQLQHAESVQIHVVKELGHRVSSGGRGWQVTHEEQKKRRPAMWSWAATGGGAGALAEAADAPSAARNFLCTTPILLYGAPATCAAVT